MAASSRVWSDHLVDVAALEEDKSRRFGRRLTLKVEENILKENKVAHLPLAVLRGALEEMTTLAIVVQRLLRQR